MREFVLTRRRNGSERHSNGVYLGKDIAVWLKAECLLTIGLRIIDFWCWATGINAALTRTVYNIAELLLLRHLR
jgi:hypothetical protein